VRARSSSRPRPQSTRARSTARRAPSPWSHLAPFASTRKRRSPCWRCVCGSAPASPSEHRVKPRRQRQLVGCSTSLDRAARPGRGTGSLPAAIIARGLAIGHLGLRREAGRSLDRGRSGLRSSPPKAIPRRLLAYAMSAAAGRRPRRSTSPLAGVTSQSSWRASLRVTRPGPGRLPAPPWRGRA
jgi:hypothetical protein